MAIARIMRDYCGAYKNELTLNLGLRLLNELKTTELASAYASNPHELGRLLECHSLITMGELVMKASLERKASNSILGFHRLDYPRWTRPGGTSCCPSGRRIIRSKSGNYPWTFISGRPMHPLMRIIINSTTVFSWKK